MLHHTISCSKIDLLIINFQYYHIYDNKLFITFWDVQSLVPCGAFECNRNATKINCHWSSWIKLYVISMPRQSQHGRFLTTLHAQTIFRIHIFDNDISGYNLRYQSVTFSTNFFKYPEDIFDEFNLFGFLHWVWKYNLTVFVFHNSVFCKLEQKNR